MEVKRCSRCREERQLIDFSRDKSKKDGLSGRCKDCDRFYKKVKRKKKLPQPDDFEEYQSAFEEYCNDEEIN